MFLRRNCSETISFSTYVTIADLNIARRSADRLSFGSSSANLSIVSLANSGLSLINPKIYFLITSSLLIFLIGIVT